MEPVSSCRRVTDDALALISTVQGSEWSAATPCEGWDARTLVNHMIGTATAFVGGLWKATANTDPAPLDLGAGDAATVYERANGALSQGMSMGFSDAELPEAYKRAAAALVAAWEQPGATERTIQMSFGPLPGVVALKVSTADSMIHAWDLAKALGRPFDMDQEAAEATIVLMQQFNDPAQRGPGKGFGHVIPWPETAPLQERLLALSGRQP
jgi:uncharacterized protein (TIGR03086 family)